MRWYFQKARKILDGNISSFDEKGNSEVANINKEGAFEESLYDTYLGQSFPYFHIRPNAFTLRWGNLNAPIIATGSIPLPILDCFKNPPLQIHFSQV